MRRYASVIPVDIIAKKLAQQLTRDVRRIVRASLEPTIRVTIQRIKTGR